MAYKDTHCEEIRQYRKDRRANIFWQQIKLLILWKGTVSDGKIPKEQMPIFNAVLKCNSLVCPWAF